ncbi:MAG: S-methyl-5-thioribose-1-phosphate isomerase, partial [Calditrichia bacterium]
MEWHKDHLRIIDQTQLPLKNEYIDLYTIEDVFESIQKLKIRGAPAIGIIAGYGLYLSVWNKSFSDESEFFNYLENQISYLASARPTAVN